MGDPRVSGTVPAPVLAKTCIRCRLPMGREGRQEKQWHNAHNYVCRTVASVTPLRASTRAVSAMTHHQVLSLCCNCHCAMVMSLCRHVVTLGGKARWMSRAGKDEELSRTCHISVLLRLEGRWTSRGGHGEDKREHMKVRMR